MRTDEVSKGTPCFIQFYQFAVFRPQEPTFLIEFWNKEHATVFVNESSKSAWSKDRL